VHVTGGELAGSPAKGPVGSAPEEEPPNLLFKARVRDRPDPFFFSGAVTRVSPGIEPPVAC
jgi:hypothetical protein